MVSTKKGGDVFLVGGEVKQDQDVMDAVNHNNKETQGDGGGGGEEKEEKHREREGETC